MFVVFILLIILLTVLYITDIALENQTEIEHCYQRREHVGYAQDDMCEGYKDKLCEKCGYKKRYDEREQIIWHD